MKFQVLGGTEISIGYVNDIYRVTHHKPGEHDVFLGDFIAFHKHELGSFFQMYHQGTMVFQSGILLNFDEPEVDV